MRLSKLGHRKSQGVTLTIGSKFGLAEFRQEILASFGNDDLVDKLGYLHPDLH